MALFWKKKGIRIRSFLKSRIIFVFVFGHQNTIRSPLVGGGRSVRRQIVIVIINLNGRVWLWDAGEREAGTYITWSKDLQRHVPCTWPGSMVSPPPLAPWPPLLAPTGGFWVVLLCAASQIHRLLHFTCMITASSKAGSFTQHEKLSRVLSCWQSMA